ncbi:hypothetical protein Moror_13089 [Moniliophthora roreri MCA 2997]|uniref:Uncharacterized protein n=1 Tax=Moniliophthora roreri (strain MCA 2997) TaxID=1381753 RepID=V2YQ88_MONRO|nr:hypothetical protein Moror_13089 [Moniliophthora roreri MCA 2997]
MASSVALVFAVNLATIGGHLAEMISIFVYPVIGYLWTRRRRRTSTADFGMAEISQPIPSLEPTSSIAVVTQTVIELNAILEGLEAVAKDTIMEQATQHKLEELVRDHKDLEEAVSHLTCLLYGNTDADSIDTRQKAFDISTKMLSFQSRRLSVIGARDSATDEADLEAGLKGLPSVSFMRPVYPSTDYVGAIPTKSLAAVPSSTSSAYSEFLPEEEVEKCQPDAFIGDAHQLGPEESITSASCSSFGECHDEDSETTPTNLPEYPLQIYHRETH